jgi:hypothetical protein
MQALEPTSHRAEVVWLGYVPHRDAQPIETIRVDRMPLDFAGYAGEVHAGLNRPACSRVSRQHPRDTEIRNVRQLSVVSAEELALIAADLGLDGVDPAWLGASVVVRGIVDFTHVPPSSRLQAPDGATLVVDMLNRPCHLPAMTIEAARPGHGKAFRRAAEGRRGVTAWVERPGTLAIGETLRLHVPVQRAWTGDLAVVAAAD